MLAALRRCPTSVPRSITRITTSSLSASRASSSRLTQVSRLQQCAPARSFTVAARWRQEAVSAQEAQSQEELITKFEQLRERNIIHPSVIDTLTRNMRLTDMTDIQSATLNQALKGTDIIAQAKTGTGKTIAFLLPILQRILERDPTLAERTSFRRTSPDDIRAIIISPTRELAEQIADEARKLCQNTNVIVQAAVGGTQKNSMLRQTQSQGCHILVGTPGRLTDVLEDPSSGIAAPNLDCFVLDEADRLLDAGFWPEVQRIQRILPHPEDTGRQTLMFSATMARDVVHIAEETLKPGYEFISTITEDDVPTIERVPQKVARVENMENMYPALYELAIRETKKAEQEGGRPFKAIVFFSSTAEVALGAAVFNNLQKASQNGRAFLSRVPVIELHSKLTQSQRTGASGSFKRARGAMLFSSDVSARGMDFPDVTHVIQMGLPSNTESYIHRVGRTGRAGKEGEGWLIINKLELPEARHRLRGLPIQPDDSLKSGAVNMTAPAQLPANVAQVLTDIGNAFKAIHPGQLTQVYKAFFGLYQWFPNKQMLVDSMAQLSRFGWGLSQPPAISSGLASKMRLGGLRNVNIGMELAPPSSGYGGRFQGPGRVGREGGFGDRGGFGGGYGGGRGGGYGGGRGGEYGGGRGGQYGGGGGRGYDGRGGGRPTASF